MDSLIDKKQVFETLLQFISDIIGEDIVEEMDITEESSFTKDLEMDSIEIVAFAEKVKSYYGDNVDFSGWLSDMEFEDLMNLNLNQVSTFIADAHNSNQ